jgi:peroxiredoxin
MRLDSRLCRAVALIGLCASAMSIGSAQTAPGGGQVAPVAFDQVFPAVTLKVLNSQGEDSLTVDLATVIGTKPVIFYYWIAGHPRADAMFQELQAIVDDEGSDKVALFGLAFPQPGRDATAVRKRAGELGIRVPILEDDEFRIGQQLRVQTVPNLTILDGQGKLRLTNGAGLSQVIGYKTDVEGAVRKVAQTGTLTTFGFLARYYPVKELIGRKCPDFTAPLLSTDVEQQWSSMISGEKLNVLIFWSVNCPHCRESLPEINSWIKANPDGVNIISAAGVLDDASKSKTKEYCDQNAFVFPTLVDQDLQISTLYQVTSTPTILIIRPDGVVDSVMTSALGDFGKTIEASKRKLLGG